MSAITDQQTTDAQFGEAVTLWDPELSWGSQRSVTDTRDNQGCPPGYGTIYTAGGNICRLVSTATAQIIRQDAAPGFVDRSIINIASAAEAVAQGAGQVVGAVGSVLGDTLRILAPWLVIGAVAYLWLMSPTRR